MAMPTPSRTLALFLGLLPGFTLCLARIPAQEPGSGANAVQEEEETAPGLNSGTLSGLRFRSIGPALTGGRVTDFAVDPRNRARYFAALASGGVWKTENAGTTWKPVFDTQSSYSIGCVELEPGNPNVVWVGTGENNSQRSVSWGDGVYKSLDGGQTWERMGLEASEHIGMIAIDPRDPETVFVAAQGPLWKAGGDRGLYKTTDGGQTWRKVLEIDEHTGVNEVHFDPRDPDILYASSYQRRRRVWTLINGGPGSAIWKSTDGGETWRKLTRGLPRVDLGRIGLDVSPADPDVVYAIVEAAEGKSGFFRSADRGESWTKMSSTTTSSPQYYNEIVCDPVRVDRVYLMDTWLRRTEDGGRSFHRVPNTDRHVDDHALWIDPDYPDYLLVGCDGGVYESFDDGRTWDFKANLPVAQFYRVSVDNSSPFYYVYGGTQDNNSLGGPARTLSRAGIANEDWFVTVGGDGYETLADPEDPMILYSLWQYGGLVRHDRRSGEIVDIKPRERPGDEPYRWNWDSPLILSPHSHTRLYFAAQRVFRSDDRGNSWTPISEDLTRNLDRNQLEVMGRIWEVDAVSKNRSTSFYGNIVSLTESPLVEGLIYAGTDDGLVQVTEDGGRSWRRIESFPGVPEMTYVSRLEASLHDADTVYAAFDNHKNGDFRPYLLRSRDRGRSWESIASDLPERHVVYALMEDHVKPELLFAGTEFGCFVTVDGGSHWVQLKGGLPTIAVRDIDIQRRENDLVLGTFGRSFYVLDDYSPLRQVSSERLEKEAAILFPVRDALLYIENSRLGGRNGRGSQGASFFTAPNPPFGATFTWYLKDKLMTRKEKRLKAQREARKEGRTLPYPTWEELRAEDEEFPPEILLTVEDDTGAVVSRISGTRNRGIHRAAWDLRYPSPSPIQLGKDEDLPPWATPDRGPLALPGIYRVRLQQQVDGVVTTLAGPVEFEVVPLNLATLAAADREEVFRFQQKVAHLSRAVDGTVRALGETEERLRYLKAAVQKTPGADLALLQDVARIQRRLHELRTALTGDRTVARRQEPTPPSIQERVRNIVSNQWNTTQPPTETEREAWRIAADAFGPVLEGLRELREQDLVALEQALEGAGAPWTPGRLPNWEREDG